MIKKIDGFLNKMTMYRAVLYCLLLILAAAIGLSFFSLLPFGPLALITSAVFIMAVSILSNAIFAWAFKAPTNIDSVYITALILTLILTPAKPFTNLLFLTFVSVIAMASKYIFAVGKKHFFNPAAISIVLVGLVANQSASWWTSNLYMMPFVFIGGLLVVRKIKRFDMVFSFFAASLLTNLIFNLINRQNILSGLERALVYSIANLPEFIPDSLNCRGLLSEKEIIEEVPDYMDRFFYISGPNSMVNAFVNYLSNIGVKRSHIKTDYFPGFA